MIGPAVEDADVEDDVDDEEGTVEVVTSDVKDEGGEDGVPVRAVVAVSFSVGACNRYAFIVDDDDESLLPLTPVNPN